MGVRTTSTPANRARAVLRAALAAVFVSSIVHYTDNFVRFDSYAQGNAGFVTKPLVAISWVLFTALGAIGYMAYRRGLWGRAAWCFAGYSASGLISPLHYTLVSPSSFDAVQHTFIITDFLAGLALLSFALWLFSTRVKPLFAPAQKG